MNENSELNRSFSEELQNEEYLLRHYRINLDAQQKADYFKYLNLAQKIKLPQLRLRKRNKMDQIPGIGFYSPSYESTQKRITKNIFIRKDKIN